MNVYYFSSEFPSRYIAQNELKNVLHLLFTVLTQVFLLYGAHLGPKHRAHNVPRGMGSHSENCLWKLHNALSVRYSLHHHHRLLQQDHVQIEGKKCHWKTGLQVKFCYILKLVQVKVSLQNYRSAQKRLAEEARTKRTNRMLIAMVVIIGVSWFPINLINLVADCTDLGKL